MSEIWTVFIIPSFLLFLGLFVEYWIIPYLLTLTRQKISEPPTHSFSVSQVSRDHSKLKNAYYFIAILITGGVTGFGASLITDSIDPSDIFTLLAIAGIVLGSVVACYAEYLFETSDDFLILRIPMAGFWGMFGGFIGVVIVYIFMFIIAALPLLVLLFLLLWSFRPDKETPQTVVEHRKPYLTFDNSPFQNYDFFSQTNNTNYQQNTQSSNPNNFDYDDWLKQYQPQNSEQKSDQDKNQGATKINFDWLNQQNQQTNFDVEEWLKSQKK